MSREISKTLNQVIRQSLNPDQVNYIAQLLDSKFDLHEQSGFGKRLAIPSQAAAETIIHYFNNVEDQIHFFEAMLAREGVFIYDSTIHIQGKQSFIELLWKKRWIFDPDTQMFFRDPFFEDEINFLKSIELVDLRQNRSAQDVIAEIERHTEKLKVINLEWFINIRLYGMDQDADRLLKKVVELLLLKQDLTRFAYEIYFCMRELAVNAGKATYKSLYAEYSGLDSDGGETGYQELLNSFREEIDEFGDENLVAFARKKDKYFDLFFKSGVELISVWATNYTTISKIEKIRLLKKLKVNRFDDRDFFEQDDEFGEGAGLGVEMITSIMKKFYHGKEPIKVVFYPDQTKIGFVLKRSELLEARIADGQSS